MDNLDETGNSVSPAADITPAADIAPPYDFTPAADPHVQALVAENAQLKTERDQIAAINARLQRKLDTLRDGIDALSQRIKERGK